jgi:hypothetical protein
LIGWQDPRIPTSKKYNVLCPLFSIEQIDRPAACVASTTIGASSSLPLSLTFTREFFRFASQAVWLPAHCRFGSATLAVIYQRRSFL